MVGGITGREEKKKRVTGSEIKGNCRTESQQLMKREDKKHKDNKRHRADEARVQHQKEMNNEPMESDSEAEIENKNMERKRENSIQDFYLIVPETSVFCFVYCCTSNHL